MSFFLPVNATTEEYGDTAWVPHDHPGRLRDLPDGWEYIEVPGHWWRAQKDPETGEMVPLEPAPPSLEKLKSRARQKIKEHVDRRSEPVGLDRDLADEAIRLAEKINAGEDPAAEDYPLIRAEAEERGMSRQEAIDAVMAWVDERKGRLAELHRKRTRAGMAVEAATTEQEVNDALEHLR